MYIHTQIFIIILRKVKFNRTNDTNCILLLLDILISNFNNIGKF